MSFDYRLQMFELSLVRLDSLVSNEFHDQLFPDLVCSASIVRLADDIRQRGLQMPIQISGQTIVDGHRRALACMKVGYQTILAVQLGDMTSEQQQRHILASCESQRRASLREQARLYAAHRHFLAEEHGRQGSPPSSPDHPCPAGAGYWSAGRIRSEAAVRAGFPTWREADKAVALFERGSPRLIQRVLDGRLTLNAAAMELPTASTRRKASR